MRAMTYDVFERRYQPIDGPEKTPLHDAAAATAAGADRVWTVLDCDGKLYLASGFHYVNRTGDYVIGKVPHEYTTRDVLYAD